MTERKILIVDDDAASLVELAGYLRGKDNTVLTADTLCHASELFIGEGELDLLVVDTSLSDGSGLELLKEERFASTPAVIFSEQSTDESVLAGFSAGAVDYIFKPCSPKVFEQRIARRLPPKKESLIKLNDVVIDPRRRTVKYFDVPVTLTPSEFNVLHFLVTHSGNFYTSDEIYESVWGLESLKTVTVRKHISAIRRKFGEIRPTDNLILSEFGKGYCFPLPPED